MSVLVLHILTIFILVFRYSVASDYEQNCSFQDVSKETFTCSFNVTKEWDFFEFRRWLNSFLKNPKEVILDIECGSDGSLIIPRRMAGSYVAKFNIRGCLLVEDYKFHDSGLSVELTTDVTLEDCVIKINSYEYVKNQIENLSARNCDEQLSLKSEIMRNVSFVFSEYNKTLLSEVLQDAGVSGETFAQSLLKAEENCIYENMTYYERSFINPNSGMHNDPHSQTLYKMPNLRVYNFSSNSLLEVPSTSKTIRYYYPSLEILDLSNNNVEEISFSALNSSLSTTPLYIDLRNNNISSVSENLVQEFLENDVIVDLRNNPIMCDCSSVSLKKYLVWISTTWPKWTKTAKDVTCSQPSELADKLLSGLDDQILCSIQT